MNHSLSVNITEGKSFFQLTDYNKETKMSSANRENVLYWLDPNAKDHIHLHSQLNQLVNNKLTIFDNPNNCIERIRSLQNEERVVLVVSGQFDKELVPTVNNSSQVLAIYIYCSNRDIHLQWVKNYKKASY